MRTRRDFPIEGISYQAVEEEATQRWVDAARAHTGPNTGALPAARRELERWAAAVAVQQAAAGQQQASSTRLGG